LLRVIGSRNLGRFSKAITVLNTIGDHAPDGLATMNFRQGVEAIIDCSANLGTSATAKALVGYGLVIVGIECPILAFMIATGSSLGASAAYSSLIRPVVNELGQGISPFVVQLPAASLAQVREERESQMQLVDLICEKIGSAFQGHETQSIIPVEFDITPTIREPLVQMGRIS
jgi:hypothetical protein